MSDTKKYIVIKKHTLNHKVGDEITLSDSKAAALVNKIELVPAIEVKKEKSLSKRLAK